MKWQRPITVDAYALGFYAAIFLVSGIVNLTHASLASADTTTVQSFVDAACSNNGALLTKVIAWGGGVIAACSFVANFRSKIPPGVMKVIDGIALNWVKSEAAAAEK